MAASRKPRARASPARARTTRAAPAARPPRARPATPPVAGPPRPPAIFVGRERELAQLERGLARVPVAVICGLAGVGKSSLAYAVAAAWPGPSLHAHAGRGPRADEPARPREPDARRRAPPLAALLDELLRRAGAAVDELVGDDERAAALARALDEQAGLAVIDDLERLPVADQARLLAAVGARLTRGRLVVTSREWPAAAQGYDRVEVHLGGLPSRAARALWSALDALRGATTGFARAFEATGGNPFLLRRRHAGDASGPEPLAQAIAALPTDAARLLGVIALARTPLSSEQAATIADVDGRAPLAELRRALLLDLDGDRRPLVHELVREAASAGLAEPVRRELHARLAAALAGERSVAAIAAVVHHALAAGSPERARDHLLARAKALFDQGASRELVELIASLPPAAADDELEAIRARALVRLLDVAAGEAALRRALARPTPAGASLISLGTLALAAGRFDEARRALARAGDDRSLPPVAQASQAALSAVLEFHAEGAPAIARLAAASEAAQGTARALLWATATYLTWLDRYTVAADRRGTPTSDNRPPAAHGYRAAALGAFAFGGYELAASPGDSGRALTLMEATLRDHRDPLSTIHRDALRALRQWEAGDRLAALSGLRAVAGRAEEAGYVLGVLWAQVFLGRVLYVLGLRTEARTVLDRVAERARALGAPVVARAAASAADDDPVTRLAMATRDDGPPSPSVRTRAFQAIAGAARGAPRREPAAPPGEPRPGYHVEAALELLAAGLTARRGGDERAWQAARAAAGRALAPADPDLLDALLAVVEARGDGAAAGGTPPLIVDRVRHELVSGPTVIALRTRPVLRRLLYALVERLEHTATKDDLTQAVWGQPYDPLRHDNPLFVNLSRLRQVVRGTGLAIDVDNERGGYRLTSRDPVVFARRR